MSYFISGDWPFFSQDELSRISWLPDTWYGDLGFGSSSVSRLWIDYFSRLVIKIFSVFELSWFYIDKIIFIGIVVIGVISIWKFLADVFTDRTQRIIGMTIYLLSSYILMVFGGGQLGVALAYMYFPLVFRQFRRFFNVLSFSEGLRFAIAFGLLVIFDLRFAYIFVLATVLYILWFRVSFWHMLKVSWLPFTLILLAHSFWVVPAILSLGTLKPEGTESVSGLSFFSFGSFSNSLSLLHPNWPENLFGKVYFFRPEFLLIPIIAYLSFLFFGGKAKWHPQTKFLLYMGAIGIVGAFLGKGVMPPFGKLYEWLFRYLPGFIMFRDPTKFYVLVSLSYAVLIPFTVKALLERSEKVRKRFFFFHKNFLPRSTFVIFILCWLLIHREIWSDKAFRNFQFLPQPVEYEILEKNLRSDRIFSRVLWLPSSDAFRPASDVHPVVEGMSLITESSPEGILRFFSNPASISLLQEKGVGYIVVPIDVHRSIFLDHYEYQESLRNDLITGLDALPFSKVNQYQQLAVYKLAPPKGLITTLPERPISYSIVSPNSFQVLLRSTDRKLTLRYNHDPNWRLTLDGITALPEERPDGFMEFSIPSNAQTTEGKVYYYPDSIAAWASVLSAGSIICIVIILFKHRAKLV